MRRMQRRAHSAATNHRSDRRQQAMRGRRAGPRTTGATRSAKSLRGPLKLTWSGWFRGRTALRSSRKDARRCNSRSNSRSSNNSSSSSLRRRGRRRCADRNRLLICGRERCEQRRPQVRFTFLLLLKGDDLYMLDTFSFLLHGANTCNGQLPGTPRRRFCRILLPPLLREYQSLPLRSRFRLRHSQSP